MLYTEITASTKQLKLATHPKDGDLRTGWTLQGSVFPAQTNWTKAGSLLVNEDRSKDSLLFYSSGGNDIKIAKTSNFITYTETGTSLSIYLLCF